MTDLISGMTDLVVVAYAGGALVGLVAALATIGRTERAEDPERRRQGR